MLFVPTATMESRSATLAVYEALRGGAEVSHLHFHPWPPDELRAFALEHDVIFVAGGNTANMLAVWRVHSFDAILRSAWEELQEIVASADGAAGYRVSAEGEERLPTRLLP